jgi:hypothetical protein
MAVVRNLYIAYRSMAVNNEPLLTPWSRGIFEKLIIAQLVQKFPAFCDTPT